MTPTVDSMLDQVLDLAERLSPTDKLRLIERLAAQVLQGLDEATTTQLIEHAPLAETS